MKSLLCWLGIHKWESYALVGISPIKTDRQRCCRCGLKREIDMEFLFWKETEKYKFKKTTHF